MKNSNKWKWRYRSVVKNTYICKWKLVNKYTLYSSDSIKYKYKEWIHVHYYYLNFHYYRHPKTLNELKQYDKKYSRACRNKRRLPTAWNDIHTKEYKSWKHTTKRSHQWKNEKHSKIRQEMINNNYKIGIYNYYI